MVTIQIELTLSGIELIDNVSELPDTVWDGVDKVGMKLTMSRMKLTPTVSGMELN